MYCVRIIPAGVECFKFEIFWLLDGILTANDNYRITNCYLRSKNCLIELFVLSNKRNKIPDKSYVYLIHQVLSEGLLLT